MQPPVIVSTRPRELEADVVKFQNNREKWIAFCRFAEWSSV